ncbi:hypothetical protein M9H77_34253 [Catharanthus roseus]|uniref:Uncharacterized protein n=1 Tax=Catharanthus roseus TaxID=4058 RepID=A0ACB9ZMI9_CATRO|nr:hypothetical protein M9H77_34253 [Catharanthus roseus]
MRKKQFDKLVQEPAEGNAWHADHLVPVYQGGGECRLENMRTLCVTCHADVTAAQCAERRLAREMAKRQLKALMKNLKDAEESGEINGNIQDHEQFDNQEKMEEDLFVEVPGSAYSIGKPIITTRSPDQEPPSSIS